MRRAKVIVRWIKIIAIAALVLGPIAYVTLLPPLAERTVIGILKSSGFPTANLKINVVSPTCLQITNFQTGPDEALRIGSLTAEYSPWSLLQQRINHISIEGLEFTAKIRAGKLDPGSMRGVFKSAAAASAPTSAPASSAQSPTPNAPAPLSLPFDTLEVRSSAIIVDYEGYKIRLPIRVLATYSSHVISLGGELKIDSLVEPLTIPLHIASTCDTRTWAAKTLADITVGSDLVAATINPSTTKPMTGSVPFFRLSAQHEMKEGHWNASLAIDAHAAGAAIDRDGSVKLLDRLPMANEGSWIPVAMVSGCDSNLRLAMNDRFQITDASGSGRIEKVTVSPLTIKMVEVGLERNDDRVTMKAGVVVDHPMAGCEVNARVGVPCDLASLTSGPNLLSEDKASIDLQLTSEATIRGGTKSLLAKLGIDATEEGVTLGAGADLSLIIHPTVDLEKVGETQPWQVILHPGKKRSERDPIRLADMGNGILIRVPKATQTSSGIGIENCVIQLLGIGGTITPSKMSLKVPAQSLSAYADLHLPFEVPDAGVRHFIRINATGNDSSLEWRAWMAKGAPLPRVQIPELDFHFDHDGATQLASTQPASTQLTSTEPTSTQFASTQPTSTQSTDTWAFATDGGLKVANPSVFLRTSLSLYGDHLMAYLRPDSFVQAQCAMFDPSNHLSWKTGLVRMMCESEKIEPSSTTQPRPLKFQTGPFPVFSYYFSDRAEPSISIKLFAASPLQFNSPDLVAQARSTTAHLNWTRYQQDDPKTQPISLDCALQVEGLSVQADKNTGTIEQASLTALISPGIGKPHLQLKGALNSIALDSTQGKVQIPSGNLNLGASMDDDQTVHGQGTIAFDAPTAQSAGYTLGAKSITVDLGMKRDKDQAVHLANELKILSPTVSSKDLNASAESISLGGQILYSSAAPIRYNQALTLLGAQASHSSTFAVTDMALSLPLSDGIIDAPIRAPVATTLEQTTQPADGSGPASGKIHIGKVHYKSQDLFPIDGTLSLHDGKIGSSLAADLGYGAHFSASANLSIASGSPKGTVAFAIPSFELADSRDLMIKLGSMDIPAGDAELSGQFGVDGKIIIDGPAITPSIAVSIDNARYASRMADIEVTGIHTKFAIDSFSPLSSAPAQEITAKTIQLQKINMHDARIRMEVQSPTAVLVEQTHMGWGDHGLLQTTAFRWHAGSQDIDVDLLFENVDIKDILEAFANGKVSGTGGVYGRIPIVIRPLEKEAVTLQEGFLFVKPGQHATFKINDPVTIASLKSMADSMIKGKGYPVSVENQIRESVLGLADFEADILSIVFYRENGEGKCKVETSGKGKGLGKTNVALIPIINIPNLDIVVSQGFNYWYNWQSIKKVTPPPSQFDDMF